MPLAVKYHKVQILYTLPTGAGPLMPLAVKYHKVRIPTKSEAWEFSYITTSQRNLFLRLLKSVPLNEYI